MLPHFLGLSEMLTDTVMLEYKNGRKEHFILVLLRCVDYFSSCKLNCHFDFWHVTYLYIKCFNEDQKVKTAIHYENLENNS